MAVVEKKPSRTHRDRAAIDAAVAVRAAKFGSLFTSRAVKERMEALTT
jgi:hypothetical protein